MAEPTPYNLTEAMHDNGFVDFYQMLGVAPDASTDEVRQRINVLYSEAQANRDHRNLNKRRDYQTLLEMLPQARTALLESDKRERYDEFAAQAQSGGAGDFTTFMAGLSGAVSDQDRTDVLGVKDAPTTAPRATVRPAPSATPARPRQSQVKSSASRSLTGSAIAVIVFVLIFLLAHFAVGQEWGMSLLIAAIAGAVTWFITHASGNKIAR